MLPLQSDVRCRAPSPCLNKLAAVRCALSVSNADKACTSDFRDAQLIFPAIYDEACEKFRVCQKSVDRFVG